jgi:alkaline phosphatase D
MQLLNLWGERPEAIQRLYEAAYKVLAANRDATFADLARDAHVQRLCAEAGVTHFGGPMLGANRARQESQDY